MTIGGNGTSHGDTSGVERHTVDRVRLELTPAERAHQHDARVVNAVDCGGVDETAHVIDLKTRSRVGNEAEAVERVRGTTRAVRVPRRIAHGHRDGQRIRGVVVGPDHIMRN